MLSGRERESSAVAALLSGARHGRGGALLLVGESGIGKSALLRHAFVSAEGMAVLRTAALSAEAGVAYGGLHRLVRSRLGRSSPPTDPADVLRLLADPEAPWPLLCLVDDAQWLDRESAEALAYVARRLGAERVALLVALREGAASALLEAGLPQLRLEPLRRPDADELLIRRYPESSPALRERITAQASGNPRTLVDLGAAAG